MNTTGLRLVLTRTVDATIDAVFMAWTDADAIREWASPEGIVVAHATSDPIVGGRYSIAMQEPAGTIHLVTGTYLVFDPPHTFVKTWHWDNGGGGGGVTQLAVQLRDAADGRTEITLIHEYFTDEATQRSHTDGWTSTLNRLVVYLTPGRRETDASGYQPRQRRRSR